MTKRKLELDPMDQHTSLLVRYTEKAKGLNDAALVYSLADVVKTMAVFRDSPVTEPYMAKLLAEIDAYTVEQAKRQRARLKKLQRDAK